MVSSLETTFACRAIGEAGKTMCEGELRQIESRGNYDLSEDDYLDIIADKTAALCACCCRLGAHYAGAEPSGARPSAGSARTWESPSRSSTTCSTCWATRPTTGKSLGTDL